MGHFLVATTVDVRAFSAVVVTVSAMVNCSVGMLVLAKGVNMVVWLGSCSAKINILKLIKEYNFFKSILPAELDALSVEGTVV